MGMIKLHLRRSTIATLICLILGTAAAAFAEGVSGYAEYNYSLLNSTTTDTSGATKSKASVFNQRYNLTIDKDIFPTMRLFAGGNFEKNDSDNDTNGLNTSGSSTRINPTADLSYSNGVFNGGLGFSRRQESSQFNGVSTPTLFFDSYNGRFGWKPEGFPSLDILYSTFDNYDENRKNQDSTNSSLTLSSRYKPFESMDISYQTNYSTLTNNLAGFEAQSLNQNLRLAYNEIFFRDRISVSTSYNVATQDTKTANKGSGSISLPPSLRSIDQLFFAITPTTADPSTTPSFAGFSNPSLTSSISGTVIIGSGLAASRNNIGIKSSFSSSNIIRLLVTITAPNHTINATDYADISNSFQLADPVNSLVKVYQSPTQDGTNWIRVPATITFGQLTNPNNGALNDGFEIRLTQTAPAGTFIKIEIESLRTENLSNLFIQKVSLTTAEVYLQEVTPLQAGQSRTTSQISGLYNLNLKAKLLDSPLIYYDGGFNLDHTKSDTQDLTYRYTVINGLSLNYRFSPTLSTSARVAREDAVDPLTSSRSSDSASISVSAQPLPTITQTANYGFRQESDSGTTKRTHSLNLSNSAELYQGISFNLTAGGSLLTDNSGADQKSTTITTGLNLLPHKTLSINISISDSRAWNSSSNKPETSFYTQTGDLTVNYNPLPNIYLFGAFTINAQKDRKTQTAQSIGGSWSPFRGGALLLNTSYRENIDNGGNKDRTAVQSVRWNIRAGWFLDVSYLITTSTTTSKTTDTQVFSTSLRMSF
ncbi:MAG TPA: hypothetical protein VGJ93_01245 [Desulfuromonadaceae bacterium]|jgi:hypothetical protein